VQALGRGGGVASFYLIKKLITSIYIIFILRIIILLNISPYQNSDEKFMTHIFNIPYVVYYKFAKLELKTSLVHGETKKMC
jgi:hypothetical protein